MSRRVRLVVCSSTGQVLGALPEFEVETPWWPDVEPVVRAARARFGAELTVLRLLFADGKSDVMGGSVAYLAELTGAPPAALAPDDTPLDDDSPLRAHWARPGGAAAVAAWADRALSAAGRPRTGPVEQVKSWNLSSILRLPTAAGAAWCKSVPPFLAHEGAIMALVAAEEPDLTPPLLGADPAAGTVLLADVPGEDQWGAPADRLVTMVRRLVRLQARWAPRVDVLLGAGLPDWRPPAFAALVRGLLGRPSVRAQLAAAELAAADALAADLPRRLAALADCGLPDTLVHGDFHPGNWRHDGAHLALLDWGDSGVGHPLLDMSAFLPRVAEGVRAAVRDAWLAAWRAERPAADPARAGGLVGPVAALRQALIYQRFLDNIEKSEWCYHQDDVARWLRRALAAAS
jgi:phosphotransferase family enzyme